MSVDLLAAFAAGILVGFFMATFWCSRFVTKKFESGDGMFRPPAGTRSINVTMIGGGGGGAGVKIESEMEGMFCRMCGGPCDLENCGMEKP